MKRKTPTQKKASAIRLILIAVVTLVVAVAVLTPIIWYWKLKTDGRLALAEAKNVELALRTSSVDAYGANGTIYDQTKEEGLKTEYIDNIRRLSGAEGNIYITKWNTRFNKAQEFHYCTGDYTVYYTYDFATQQADWKVDYSIHVLRY